MKKVESNVITPGQVTFLLSGTMIGVGILTLPNELVTTAKQDAWISAFIGAVYPLYLAIIASFLCKWQPQNNILDLSKKCFGKLDLLACNRCGFYLYLYTKRVLFNSCIICYLHSFSLCCIYPMEKRV